MKSTCGQIAFASLGCPKNLVDSERLITRLRSEGYTLVNQYPEADVVIVNTCGFIDDAIAESLQTIQEAIHENGRVIVTGCLGKRAELIQKHCPTVLAVTGPQQFDAVMQAVHQCLPPVADPHIDLIPPTGLKLTPRHYAYLKISEGCNHHCTFCIIPQLRGKLRSRRIDQVLQEAETLVAHGVKEICIIAQDTSAYGVDIRYESAEWRGQMWHTSLEDLVKALNQLGIWVRLHYLYPYPHVNQIIPLLSEHGVLPYLDIPLQHASMPVLKRMKRPAYSEHQLKQIQQWRTICPSLVLRSTFIVGFPGETEDDFEQLLAFLSAANILRVGAFKYSPVDGAKANQLENPVPSELAQERYDRLMQHQAKISRKLLASSMDTVAKVIVDHIHDDGTITARSSADAPDVDGIVYVDPMSHSSQPGDFIQVNFHSHDDYDRWAKAV